MSETIDLLGPTGAKDGKAATEIAYCPHLQIYHYHRVDGSEYIFDEGELEKSIEGYLKQGNERQADFMATLTGFARQFPHQVVSFDEDGKLNLRELLAREIVVEAGPVSSGEPGPAALEAVSPPPGGDGGSGEKEK